MSTEQEAIEAPRTRTCRTCSVEINAASARCPYCGSRQFKHQPLIGWSGLLACLIAVAVAVFVTRAVVQAANSGLRYVSYRSADLTALVPSGYQDLLLASQHGTAIAGFAKPTDVTEMETVKAKLHASGSPRSRMLALAATLRNTVGVARGYLGPVTFPGGQIAWALEYTLDHTAWAVFTFDGCNRAIAVTVTLSSRSEHQLSALSLVLPESAKPICDGPAYSNRDRADPAVPLSLPK
jgi:RNA polymerase subunit RPABC4/transcription elongation factor Spt4